nr:uncharacterized protein LOC113713644 [Coffea arabica]
MVKFAEIARERMARFFYGLFFWASRALSTARLQRLRAPNRCDEHIGLACVVCSSQHWVVKQGRIFHSCMVKSCNPSRSSCPDSRSSLPWLSSSSAPSWSLSTDGDLLGTESGVHMCSADDPMPWEETRTYTSRKQRMRDREREKRWDIPPPLTILRDHEAYGGHIPWSLRREYRDGRLILREIITDQFHIQETVREDGFRYMDLVTMGNSSASYTNAAEEEGEVAQEKEGSNVETKWGREDRN